MTPHEYVAAVFERYVSSIGDRVERDGDCVRLRGSHLEITFEVSHFDQEGGTVVARLHLTSKARKWRGPSVTLVGCQASAKDSALEISNHYCYSVLPVVLVFLGVTTAKTADLGVSRMLVAPQGDTKRLIGYAVHHGPIITRKIGPADLPPDAEWDAISGVLMPLTADVAAEGRLFWLECYVVRDAEGGLDATCRLCNEDWPAGRRSLAHYADGWPDIGPTTWSQRQFLLYAPVEASQIESIPMRSPTGWGQPKKSRGASGAHTVRARPRRRRSR